MLRKLLFILSVIHSVHSSAQQNENNLSDSVKSLSEVVITATRTERKLGNVAVPVTIISQKQIQQAGSLRLRDILQETTGLS